MLWGLGTQIYWLWRFFPSVPWIIVNFINKIIFFSYWAHFMLCPRNCKILLLFLHHASELHCHLTKKMYKLIHCYQDICTAQFRELSYYPHLGKTACPRKGLHKKEKCSKWSHMDPSYLANREMTLWEGIPSKVAKSADDTELESSKYRGNEQTKSWWFG